MRPLLMNPTNAPNSRAQDLCPITRAPIAHAPRRTALTSAEMLPARESGSGRPAGPWNTAGLWNATGAWNTLGAWNIAVRTRGVFTHRDDFQKPACVERGLVRTGKTLGRPPLACTGITPVIPESAGPSALCYFEATCPTYAILRPSARPVYALFLEPAPSMRYS